MLLATYLVSNRNSIQSFKLKPVFVIYSIYCVRKLCTQFSFFAGIKDVKTVNHASTLADLGMDSLMGAEIKQTLERNYDLVLSAQEIRGLTFSKLSELASGGEPPSTSPITVESTVPLRDDTQVTNTVFRNN